MNQDQAGGGVGGHSAPSHDIVYADYQSAKPVDPRVVEAMLPYMTERFGNPSSLHGVGDEATAALDDARARVARFVGAQPDEIVFTSGATEANNLARSEERRVGKECRSRWSPYH